jgi:hypothetical protein
MRVWFRIQLLEHRFRKDSANWWWGPAGSSSWTTLPPCVCVCVCGLWQTTMWYDYQTSARSSQVGSECKVYVYMWIWKRAERSVKYMYMCTMSTSAWLHLPFLVSLKLTSLQSPTTTLPPAVGFARSRLEIAKFWWLAMPNGYLFRGIWSSSRLVGTDVHYIRLTRCMTSDVSEFLTERHRVFTNAGIMRRQISVFIVILGGRGTRKEACCISFRLVWAGPWGHGWNTSRKLHSVLYSTGPLLNC